MSVARTTFLERLAAFKDAIDVELLVSQAPSEVKHNQRARLMRNGLSVVGFAIVEDFVKARTAEVLTRIGNSPATFEQLPEKLRKASVLGVVKALRFQADLRSGDDSLNDVISFAQEHARLLASTADTAYQLSELALGWERSNLNAEDVKNILSVFLVNDPWGNIDKVAQRVGLAALPHRDAFIEAAKRRHRAAHKADADTELTDLGYFYNQALGISIGFDVLVSKCLRHILDVNNNYLTSATPFVDSESVNFRFLDDDGHKWREALEDKSRAFKLSTDFEALKLECISRARNSKQVVVVRDARKIPMQWFIQDVA